MAVKRARIGFFFFRTFVNALLFGIGLVLAVYLGLVGFQYYLSSSTLQLPDFRQLDLVGAVNQAAQMGLQMEVMRVENDPSMPSNTVLSQNPSPGTEVKRGRRIQVVVNGAVGTAEVMAAGTEMAIVPDVVDMGAQEARYLLEDEGFRIGRVVEVTHDTLPAGLVISQDPPAESSVPSGNQVNLLVSKGKIEAEPRPVQVEVPDVVGLKVEEARSLLAQRGLHVGRIEEVPMAERHPGIVIRQTIEAGTNVTSGETVGLAVATAVEGLQELRLSFPLPQVQVDITVEVIAQDDLGERVIYERVHQGGETVELTAQTKGPGKVTIYLNGYYYWEREL